MSKPLFYKSPPKWHFLLALSLAAGIELAAVALASRDGIEQVQTENRNYTGYDRCHCRSDL